MFDQAASKYAIILVCVMLLQHLTPRSKGYEDFNGGFGFKGG